MSAEVARGPAPPEVAQEVVQGLAAGALPGKFYGWLGAASVSVFGDAVLYFALGWAATGISPAWAGLVFTMILLPRAVLLLLGGAAGDRWGAGRVMIVGDAAMCGLALLLALSAHVWGAAGLLLVAAGLAIGVIDAFYLAPARPGHHGPGRRSHPKSVDGHAFRAAHPCPVYCPAAEAAQTTHSTARR
jgi:MFS family permease